MRDRGGWRVGAAGRGGEGWFVGRWGGREVCEGVGWRVGVGGGGVEGR